jgi:hypothetical protein
MTGPSGAGRPARLTGPTKAGSPARMTGPTEAGPTRTLWRWAP